MSSVAGIDEILSRSQPLTEYLAWPPQSFSIPLPPSRPGFYVVIWCCVPRASVSRRRVGEIVQSVVKELAKTKVVKSYQSLEVKIVQSDDPPRHTRVARAVILPDSLTTIAALSPQQFVDDEHEGMEIAWNRLEWPQLVDHN